MTDWEKKRKDYIEKVKDEYKVKESRGMTELDKKDIDRLIDYAQWMFDDGMVNFTYEDMIEFEEIKRKYGKKR